MAQPLSMAVSVRLQSRNLSGTRANIDHDFRRGRIPGYIDQSLMSLNSTLIEPPTPHSMKSKCIDLRNAREDAPKRAMKSDAAISTRMIITFGKGLQPHFNALDVAIQNEFYLRLSKAVADRLATELLALTAHRDESAPHAHGIMLAVNNFGTPVSKVATPKVLAEIQNLAFETAKDFLPMVERGTPKADRIERGDDASKIVNRSVKRLHEDLPTEIAAREAEIATLTGRLPELTDRVVEMEGRVEKLKSKEERLTAALEKRLTTYTTRLENRRTELNTVKTEIEGKTGELDVLKATLRDLENQKAAAETAAQKAEEDHKRAVEAAERAAEARDAVEATLAPLAERKAAAETAAQKAEEDRKRAVEAAERAAEARDAVKATLAPLGERKAALEGTIAAIAATVEELRPAFDVAHALRLLTQDQSDEELFEMMPPPGGIAQGQGQDVDGAIELWATALRMTDPFFALDVAPEVPRARDPEVNRDTLLDSDTSYEDYSALANAMKAEPGNHRRAVSGLLSGDIRLSDLSSAERAKDPGVSWVARAFAGLKRGFAFAAEAVSERSVKVAAVFEALPTAAQAALSALFRSQSADALGQKNEEPQRRRSVFDLDR